MKAEAEQRTLAGNFRVEMDSYQVTLRGKEESHGRHKEQSAVQAFRAFFPTTEPTPRPDTPSVGSKQLPSCMECAGPTFKTDQEPGNLEEDCPLLEMQPSRSLGKVWKEAD